MYHMKSVVHRCCANDNDDDLPLNGWTLRFHDRGVEQGYEKSKSAKLRAGSTKVALASAAAAAASVAMNAGEFDPGNSDNHVMYDMMVRCRVSEIAFGVAMLVWVVICQCRVGPTRVGPCAQEAVAIFFVTLGLLLGVLTEVWYMARLHGVEDPVSTLGKNDFSDTFLLLLIDMVVTAVHIALPVRWCMLWPAELVGVVFYPILVCLLGSPEQKYVFNNSIIITLLVTFSAVGKRSMERHERRAYYVIIRERIKRAESEFKLAQIMETDNEKNPRADQHTADHHTTVGSLPSTTRTEGLFENLDANDLDGRLRALALTGQKEHWLVYPEEVQFAPAAVLGAGGFGTVVAGKFGDIPVAIKVSTAAAGSGHLQQLPELVNELRILRSIRHPNIAIFYGAVVDPQHLDLALVLEWVNGTSMDRYIALAVKSSDPDHEINTYCILMGVCRALAYLHRHNFVHGDVKPANIMIETENRPYPFGKLLDFGLSRVLTKRAKPLGGSIRWVAPELLEKTQGQPRNSADVFSFGRVMHFAVNGNAVFDAVTKRTIRAALTTKDLPKMEWPAKSRLTPLCRQVAEECVQVQPDQRPRMSNVLRDLSTWRDGSCRNTLTAEVENTLHTGFVSWGEGLQQIRRAAGKRKPVKVIKVTTPASHESTAAAKTGAQDTGNEQHTRKDTQYRMLLEMLSRWALERQPGHASCCEFHCRLDQLGVIQQELRGGRCVPLPEFDGLQCTACGVLVDTSAGSDEAEFVCDICGQDLASAPRQAASPSKPVSRFLHSL